MLKDGYAGTLRLAVSYYKYVATPFFISNAYGTAQRKTAEQSRRVGMKNRRTSRRFGDCVDIAYCVVNVSERVFHKENNTPPKIRLKVTPSDTAAGTLPMKPTRKIFVPMNTSTRASAYFR